ncbi:uncharacterized protein LOC141650974 [Silene latifolia]|uniref:uncharacterized protein LOC141650974 n=1 Tax=Silene latifolia TaxID=37657 RepID=UPI003D788862
MDDQRLSCLWHVISVGQPADHIDTKAKDLDIGQKKAKYSTLPELFQDHEGTTSGKCRERFLEDNEYERAHLYVLSNCDSDELKRMERLFEDYIKREYPEWRVSYDPRDKARVKKAWEDAMKTRLRQMIYRAYHKEEHEKLDWISVDLHRQLKNRPLEDPTFTPRSEQNSANRRSGSDEKGKALATHVMGRKSTLQYMDSMIDKDGKGDIPSALQMLEKTRKHSTKGWLSKKTGQLFGKIISKKTELQSQGSRTLMIMKFILKNMEGLIRKET